MSTYTESYKGMTIEIWADDRGDSPRDWDNADKMICWHRRYNLGDPHKFADFGEFAIELARELDAPGVERLEARLSQVENDDNTTGQEAVKAVKDFDAGIMAIIHAGAVMLPLYLFDHSGLSMTTNANEFARWDSAGWDWGGVGVIYVTLERAKKEWNKTRVTKQFRARLVELLRGEVSTYDDYLRGNCWGFDVLDQDGDVLDSCGGFIGDYDGEYSALSEARSAADGYAADVKAELDTLNETTYT